MGPEDPGRTHAHRPPPRPPAPGPTTGPKENAAEPPRTAAGALENIVGTL